MNKAIIILVNVMVVCIVKADGVENRIYSMIADVAPTLQVASISQTPIKNIMKVELSNGNLVYVTQDAEFMFPGKLLQHTGNGMTDLTEQDLALKRKAKLEEVDLSETITFKSKDREKQEIFVFTDVSCAYCKKLHQHIEDFNESGFTIHYLAFPRAGMQSPAGELMRDVWCSKNRQRALTEAKQEGAITQKSKPCSNPVQKQRELGLALGVTGTPGIYDSKGRHIGGYLTPDQLSDAVN